MAPVGLLRVHNLLVGTWSPAVNAQARVVSRMAAASAARRSTFAYMFRLGFRGAAAVASSPDTEILQTLLVPVRDPARIARLKRPCGCLSVPRVIRGARGRIQLSDAAAFSAHATAEPPRQERH